MVKMLFSDENDWMPVLNSDVSNLGPKIAIFGPRSNIHTESLDLKPRSRFAQFNEIFFKIKMLSVKCRRGQVV